MTPQIYTRAARYLRLGEAYISAARGVLAVPDFEQVRLPFYGLLGHGMELALKSVAARAGWDDERLMWLGHDLDWAWRVTLSDAGFEVPGARAVGGVIRQLSCPHHAQAFRYPALLSWPLPDPRCALAAAEAYLDLVRDRDR